MNNILTHVEKVKLSEKHSLNPFWFDSTKVRHSNGYVEMVVVIDVPDFDIMVCISPSGNDSQVHLLLIKHLLSPFLRKRCVIEEYDRQRQDRTTNCDSRHRLSSHSLVFVPPTPISYLRIILFSWTRIVGNLSNLSLHRRSTCPCITAKRQSTPLR